MLGRITQLSSSCSCRSSGSRCTCSGTSVIGQGARSVVRSVVPTPNVSESGDTPTSTASMASDTAPSARRLKVHHDARGSVRETFRASWDRSVPPVVQLVHSESRPGVMRAMHAHKLQHDIWHFTEGRAFVQLYDHRTGELSSFWAKKKSTIVIPPGVSHGFYTPGGCTLIYALTREYDGTDEYEWNALDPLFPGAKLWPDPEPTRSERDIAAPGLDRFVLGWR